MEAFDTCLLKIYYGDTTSNLEVGELLAEIEAAVDTQHFEIVCLGNQDSFSIAEPGINEPFATFVQFSFPRHLSQLDQIEEAVKLQLKAACGVEVLQGAKRYRLVRLKKLTVV